MKLLSDDCTFLVWGENHITCPVGSSDLKNDCRFKCQAKCLNLKPELYELQAKIEFMGMQFSQRSRMIMVMMIFAFAQEKTNNEWLSGSTNTWSIIKASEYVHIYCHSDDLLADMQGILPMTNPCCSTLLCCRKCHTCTTSFAFKISWLQ